MAGGPSIPQLAAAVSNTGSLGCPGCGYLSLNAIREQIRATRTLTDKTFAVRFFTPKQTDPPSNVAMEEARRLLEPYRKEMGLPKNPELPAKLEESLEEQIKVILQETPPVVCFTFGVPPEGFLGDSKELGIWTIGAAKCPEEVRVMRDTLEPVSFSVCLCF
ncbi:putative nitronate monooxygenase [Hypsibius exemplaris]|uniref:Nitronate monooxygenase n=1 Tax=Hypsibius exemplaris TaxID=2072580 RepID=A0A1W0WR44_HYPEX|nr:putative nitronate monooxygenase [Hypsibius exemplaris]